MTELLHKRDFAELVRLFVGQRDAYALLLSLSRGQEKVFRRDGIRALMKVIARKQVVIDRLTAFEKSLISYTSDWETTLSTLPGPARREISSLVSQIGSVLAELVESERAIAKAVAEVRDETAAKLRTAREHRCAMNAYNRETVVAAGRIVDREE